MVKNSIMWRSCLYDHWKNLDPKNGDFRCDASSVKIQKKMLNWNIHRITLLEGLMYKVINKGISTHV